MGTPLSQLCKYWLQNNNWDTLEHIIFNSTLYNPSFPHLRKLSTKEFLMNLTLKLMPRRKKNRKLSFPRYLKIIFSETNDNQHSTSKSTPSTQQSLHLWQKFWVPHYRPLQTLIPSYEGAEQLYIMTWP